jgi:hypothetical protein
MAHMLTVKDLETRSHGTYYVGPLEEAKQFIRETENVSEISRIGGQHTVMFSQDADPTWGNCNDYGNGPTNEIAWRYALGAAFGPADDEFSAFPLTHNQTLAVRTLVRHHFPEDQRRDVFHSTTTAHAVVLDTDGNLWQVYPDGTIEVYRH